MFYSRTCLCGVALCVIVSISQSVCVCVFVFVLVRAGRCVTEVDALAAADESGPGRLALNFFSACARRFSSGLPSMRPCPCRGPFRFARLIEKAGCSNNMLQ